MNCPTCGDEVDPERVELGYEYCLKPKCVQENKKPMILLEIAQTKTNSVIKIADEKTLREMAEGKYRRDPVVVKRQRQVTAQRPTPKGTFKKPPPEVYNRQRVRFIQALADQGVRPDEIVQRGAYMNLTRREVHKYMASKRI